MVGQSASLLSEIPPWSDKVAGRRARGQLALQQQRRIGAHTWRVPNDHGDSRAGAIDNRVSM